MEPNVAGGLAFISLFMGYTSLSYTLWKTYFEPNIHCKEKEESVQQWKNQPKDHSALKEPDEDIIPVVALAKELLGGSNGQHKSDRHPKHNLFSTINLFMSCCFAGVTVYCIMAEKSRVYFELEPNTSMTYHVLWILGLTILTVIHESVVEYYWHVMMHTRFCYRRFHKFHHYYTSPAPFDDLFIHPLESFGYQCILWSPPFLYSQHYSVFILYMAIMGLTGKVVLIRGCAWLVPTEQEWVIVQVFLTIAVFISKFRMFIIRRIMTSITSISTLVQAQFNSNRKALAVSMTFPFLLLLQVNFGFPTIYLDIIHGTYLGSYCGHDFVPKYKRIREKES